MDQCKCYEGYIQNGTQNCVDDPAFDKPDEPPTVMQPDEIGEVTIQYLSSARFHNINRLVRARSHINLTPTDRSLRANNGKGRRGAGRGLELNLH